MESYENKFTFNLNETLLFELGQEIEEMISISLDPDIVVQSYDDYVQIRGVIMLTGEYFRLTDDEVETSADAPLQSNPPYRYIEKVVNVNRDVANFSHRFPVDISVSKDRVDDLDDIFVTVDSFDYKLPSTNTLNILASLHIYGINPEKNSVNDEVERRPIASFNEEDHEPEMLRMDERKEANEGETETAKEMYATNDETEKQFDAPFQESSLRLIKGRKNTSHHDDVNDEVDEMIKSEATEENTQQTEHHDEEEVITTMSETRDNEEEIQIELNELNESTDEEDDEVHDVTFLTELFESEEETYTQVTIYIAQKDDTIESIAKQYDIPVLQLLKDNKMSMDTIEEGQLITIRKQKKID